MTLIQDADTFDIDTHEDAIRTATWHANEASSYLAGHHGQETLYNAAVAQAHATTALALLELAPRLRHAPSDRPSPADPGRITR